MLTASVRMQEVLILFLAGGHWRAFGQQVSGFRLGSVWELLVDTG